ncbi:MAG: hypothetical protein AAGF12_35485 [Myxococcota bacterium]
MTRAVNREFEDEQLEDIRRYRPNCPRPPGGRWLTPTAACQSGQCTVVPAEASVTLPPVDWALGPCDTTILGEPLEEPLRVSVFQDTSAVGTIAIQPDGRIDIEEFHDDAPDALAARLLRLVQDANERGEVRFRFVTRADRNGRGGIACVGEASDGDPGYSHAVRHYIRTYRFNVRVLDEP